MSLSLPPSIVQPTGSQCGELASASACCGSCNTKESEIEANGYSSKQSTPPEADSYRGRADKERPKTCCDGCQEKDNDGIRSNAPPNGDDKDSCCSDCDEEKEKDVCCSDCDEEKEKESCCSDCDEKKEKDSSCDNPSEEKEKDDSFCMCCVRVLINEPALDISRAVPPLRDAATGPIGALRTCCQMFERYCIRKACCFISQAASQHSVPGISYFSTSSQNQEPEKANLMTPGEREGDQNKLELELEIRGMDCIDCLPKVERALGKLDSVVPVKLDYLGGIASLVYNPEVITPDVISGYVSRATGFNVKARDPGSDRERDTTITLPFFFVSPLPDVAFEGYDISHGSKPRILEVRIPIHGKGSKRPRDVFDHFTSFGAQLVPATPDYGRKAATHDLMVISLRTLVSAVLTVPVLVFAWAKLPHRPIVYGGISVGLTTATQVLAFPIFSRAARSIIHLGQVDMDLLVSISTLTAYTFSVFAYAFEVAGKPFSQPFFETSSLLITLIFLGRTISALTRRSTGSSLNELQRLQQDKAFLVTDNQSPPKPVDSRLLYYNDIIRISPGNHIATDGVVISGESDVDESSITGESGTVYKCAGMRVMAGTFNCSGELDVQITHLVHENSLSRVTGLVKKAQLSRSRVQDLVDKLSAVVLPVAAGSACIAFLVWVLVIRFVRRESNTAASVQALTYAIAILAISCPCALGLVIPTVVSIAIRRGMHEGVLFRSTESLQTGHDINVVAFDKTGTLTTGDLRIEQAEILVKGAEDIIMALVKDNHHPISQAIYRYLSNLTRNITVQTDKATREKDVTDITSIPGKGIKASLCGFTLLGGNAEFTGSQTHPLLTSLCASGYSLFCVSLASQVIAIFGLSAAPRPTAQALIKELQNQGKEVYIFSGDTRASVNHLSQHLGVPLENTRAGCTPEDKNEAVRAFQITGKRVCFVGDGTNDGPALSTADIALSIAAGSDVAVTSAGGVLISSDIHRGVRGLLDVTRASRIHIRLALLWCIVYNVFAILFASGALVKIRIEPRWAGIGEVVSIVPVVVIAFLLDVRWMWKKDLSVIMTELTK